MQAAKRWHCRSHLWALIAITLLGAALRFFRIDHPTLWYDEVMTFSRINGSFEQLLEVLRLDGFVPLHYELYWLLAHWVYPDPRVMRLVPAVAGMAMIPGIYFLARQFACVRTSLLAALIAAGSAYLLKFSRDAKMYMLCWSLATFHLGFFFLWLRYDPAKRPRQRLVWLVWIATGVAAAGVHATALLLLIVELMAIFFYRPPSWRMGRTIVAWLLGAVVILAGPIGYYTRFNQWHQRTGGLFSATVLVDGDEALLGWKVSGLDWIDRYHHGRDGPELVRFTASAFLTGWEPPPPSPALSPLFPPRPHSVAHSQAFLTSFFQVGNQNAHPSRITQTVSELGVAVMSASVILLGWGLVRAMAGKNQTQDESIEVAEHTPKLGDAMLAAIGLGIFLVVYGIFYCRSVSGFASPVDWGRQAWAFVGWPRGIVTGLVAMVAGHAMARCRCWRRLVGWSLTLVLGWQLIGHVHQHPADFLGHWLTWITTDWHLVLMAGWLVGWMVSGRPSWRFWFKVLAMIVAGWLAAEGAYLIWHHLWLKTVGHPDLAWKNIWWHRYMGVLLPLLILLVAILISHLPTKLLRFGAIVLLVGFNGINGMARVVIDSEPRWDLVAADLHQDIQADDLRVFGFQGWSGQSWRDPRWTAPSNYYLCVAHRSQPTPSEFRSGRIRQRLGYFPNLRRDRLMGELKKTPQVRRAIVWQYFSPAMDKHGSPPATWQSDWDKQGWKVKTRQTYPMWDHWTWKYEGHFERLELAIPDRP